MEISGDPVGRSPGEHGLLGMRECALEVKRWRDEGTGHGG